MAKTAEVVEHMHAMIDEIARLRAREAVWKDALQDCFDAAHELKPDYLVDFVKRRFNEALATLDLDVEEKM